jgi:hypothetical protein
VLIRMKAWSAVLRQPGMSDYYSQYMFKSGRSWRGFQSQSYGNINANLGLSDQLQILMWIELNFTQENRYHRSIKLEEFYKNSFLTYMCIHTINARLLATW